MKKRTLAIIIILFFIISAINVQAKTINKNNENEETNCTGYIYGRVLDWCDEYTGPRPLPFALIKTEFKSTRCNLNGYYNLSGLPLNIEFNITASYPRRYDSTEKVILTEEKPVWELDFYLFFNPDSYNSKLVNKAKTTKISDENYIENQHTENNESSEESSCIGRIYGSVGNSHGVYTWTSCPFALVTTGIKRARCGPLGQYSMKLSLYREYYVTAHVHGFKPLTKYVYLTLEEPFQEITFDMAESEPDNIKSNEKPKPTFYGLIFGRTGGVFEHASWRVGFTKLTFENRSTMSGFFGFYIIGRLEIGKTYSITASKEDHISLTQEVTLTAEKPIQMISFFMHPDL